MCMWSWVSDFNSYEHLFAIAIQHTSHYSTPCAVH
jgi:hypothetical protein